MYRDRIYGYFKSLPGPLGPGGFRVKKQAKKMIEAKNISSFS
jgi:hypothetical protein